jgi:hypothetical protein
MRAGLNDLRLSAVERIPKLLSDGVVYHNEEFQLAALLCACGCGHRITLLVPDSHQVSSDGGLATIRPSIAVCDAPCKSHYFVTAGKVEWDLVEIGCNPDIHEHPLV